MQAPLWHFPAPSTVGITDYWERNRRRYEEEDKKKWRGRNRDRNRGRKEIAKEIREREGGEEKKEAHRLGCVSEILCADRKPNLVGQKILLNIDEAGVAGYLILGQFRDVDVQDTILDLGSDVLGVRIFRQGKHLLELLV